jgi:hypothetical protein
MREDSFRVNHQSTQTNVFLHDLETYNLYKSAAAYRS